MKLNAAKFDVLSFCFQKKRRNTSKFTGVYFRKETSKYETQVKHGKELYYCGCFLNELEAVQAVNAKCVELNIALKNPEVGLPENKTQVRFILQKQSIKSSYFFPKLLI